MSRVARPANQRALDQEFTAGWEHSLLFSVGMIDQIDRQARNLTLMSLCSQLPEWRPLYDYWPPWRNSVHVTVQMRDSQLVYIIHLATETCDCVWEMNERSILRDLLWHIYIFETSNEVWISDTPQDDHLDRIIDCSTDTARLLRYALAWDWLREDESLYTNKYFWNKCV